MHWGASENWSSNPYQAQTMRDLMWVNCWGMLPSSGNAFWQTVFYPSLPLPPPICSPPPDVTPPPPYSNWSSNPYQAQTMRDLMWVKCWECSHLQEMPFGEPSSPITIPPSICSPPPPPPPPASNWSSNPYQVQTMCRLIWVKCWEMPSFWQTLALLPLHPFPFLHTQPHAPLDVTPSSPPPHFQFSLPQIRNLAKRGRLSCKPRMRSADSIPIVSTSVCFLPLKMYTCITKILEFEYKTDMF